MGPPGAAAIHYLHARGQVRVQAQHARASACARSRAQNDPAYGDYVDVNVSHDQERKTESKGGSPEGDGAFIHPQSEEEEEAGGPETSTQAAVAYTDKGSRGVYLQHTRVFYQL